MTQKKKTLEGILEELLNTGIKGKFKPNSYGNTKIDQAKADTKKLLHERVPEERSEDRWGLPIEHAYWNSCIDKMHEEIDKL